MPRFFFHLFDDYEVLDSEGTELPNKRAAEARGLASARELAAAAVQSLGRINLSHRIDVTDANRRVLRSITFGEVVEVLP